MTDSQTRPMKRYFYLLPCLMLSLLAFFPALTHSGLPAGADVDFHFWRVVDLANNWAQGDVLARWSELYYYGYGAPSFQYSAMGFYGLAVLAEKLPLFDSVSAIKLIWFLSLYAASVGMYRYAVKRWSASAALVSAAAYVFSPALILHESLLRGSFGVVLGMGFAALALSLLDDLLTREEGRRKRLILCAICLFLVLMSHNITAVMCGGVLFAWMLWQIIVERVPFALWGLAAFAAGCGLAAFFWVPLAFELHLVDVQRMSTSTDLDFRQGFYALSGLLGFPRPLDTTLINPPPQTTLGLAQWILGFVGGAAALFTLKQKISREMFFWVIVAVVAVFLIIPPAAPVWERITPLQQILFPIRFLNVAAFALAILAGMGASALTQHWRGMWARRGVPALVLFALGFTGLMSTPWLWRDDFPREAQPADYLAFELETSILGTTAANEFLPPTVLLLPPPTGFVLDSFTENSAVQRLNRSAYPEGTQIDVLESSPAQYVFSVESAAPLTLEIYQLYFPLWQAFVDGVAAESRPSEPYGLTLIDVPAGAHTVALSYPLSVPQIAGVVVSVVTFIGLVGFTLLIRVTQQAAPQEVAPREFTPFQGIREATLHTPFMFFGVFLALGIVAVLIASGRLGYITSEPYTSPSADHALNAVFEDTAVLSGISTHQPYTGRVWEVDLYWYFESDTPVNGFVHVLDENGQIVAQLDKLNINLSDGERITGQMRDTYVMAAPETRPPADYRLRVGLWRCLDAVNSFECGERQTPEALFEGQINADGWIVLDSP